MKAVAPLLKSEGDIHAYLGGTGAEKHEERRRRRRYVRT